MLFSMHQHAIGDGDRQRASAAAFAGDGGDERNLQPRHLAQVVGDGFGLSALFGAQAGIRADYVNQRDHRAVPLLGELHEAQRLAIALRIRLAEVAIDALLGVAAFLRAEHGNFPALEARHAANHGGIVAKSAVAVNFAEVGKDALDVVQRIGPHGMARQFGALPWRELARDLPAQSFHALLQAFSCLQGLLIVGGSALQLLNLLFDALQFRLRFRSCFHEFGWSQCDG